MTTYRVEAEDHMTQDRISQLLKQDFVELVFALPEDFFDEPEPVKNKLWSFMETLVRDEGVRDVSTIVKRLQVYRKEVHHE